MLGPGLADFGDFRGSKIGYFRFSAKIRRFLGPENSEEFSGEIFASQKFFQFSPEAKIGAYGVKFGGPGPSSAQSAELWSAQGSNLGP